MKDLMSAQNEKLLAELQISKLPTLPQILTEMIDACQGSKASFQDISVIINRDAAIAARVVSMANSSFYNRGTEINSLERALFVLGTDTIKTIVITAAIQQFFSGLSQTHTNNLKKFWRHSLATALTAKSLAILTSYNNPDEAYLTGLLHNVGELVLESNFPKAYEVLASQPDDRSLSEREKEQIGVSHQEVGAYLASQWGLGSFAVDAIEFHHEQLSSIRDAHHLAKLIYLASTLSENQALDSQSAFDAAQALFELNASLVSEIVSKISSEVDEISQTLGIHAKSDENDQRQQVQLARKVRDIGLLQSTANELNRANSKQDLGRAFKNALELLFGYSNSVVCWYDDNKDEVRIASDENSDNPTSAIKFKLNNSSSIIARSAQRKQIMSSLDTTSELEDKLSVADQQILKRLKTKGIVCIPIFSSDKLFCILVAGHNHTIEQESNQRLHLDYFSTEIVNTCEDTLANIDADKDSISADELSQRAHEIAHEANNPLNIIGNYLATLGAKLNNNSDVQEELSILKEEVERAGSILLRLRDLQQSHDSVYGSTDINLEISRLTKLYKSSLFLTNQIECSVNLDETLGSNAVNRNSLRQILTNLIKNAVEAQPKGGKIVIETIASVNVNGNDFVEIKIKDSGPGIEQHILRSLFQPTTSTKGDRHSGLGLSITKNLVTEAKGSISCRSSNKGSEFQVLLPVKQAT